ncbi:Capsid portal protein [Eptesicus fuscus gammaherpesvirus]|uniref:Capsid portal protein n=1 Tax=vespertilionid gammaherpesvirus 3 TaxID=2846598 RepID=A0A2D1AF03_9GAMA|nr:Capsid portal protein [Eptesicus fuscus gammaherpesvirus]ATA58272.1 Capsid portal protein [Eptesicus fuscus gammaherpesvirus]WAH70896.1 capsid portal protein [Eptesicus fuscus gammaherpesvirus]
MFKMNPGAGSGGGDDEMLDAPRCPNFPLFPGAASGAAPAIVIHPTRQSVALFEIIQGKYCYVKGQTLLSSLRHPGAFFRQLFVHLYRAALSSCSYDDVVADWQDFEAAIRARWTAGCETSESFRQSTFKSWADTMKMTIEQILLSNIYQVLHSKTNLSYSRYVDWVLTTGLVPVCRHSPDLQFAKRIKAQFDATYRRCCGNNRTIRDMFESFEHELQSIVFQLTALYVPDYSEVIIEYHPDSGTFSGVCKNKRIKVEVINRPVVFNSTVTFDSPVQRLYSTIMTCYRTTEHAKLCQLLNTAPVKAITGSASSNMYRDILAHLEQASNKKPDPKKELFQLLVKLAENRTVTGVTDVVEDFVTDVSQNIVDKNKLFGTRPETTTQGLRRQVSNTVFKALTNQINEQFDTIHALEKERELFAKKLRQIETQLARRLADERAGCGGTGGGGSQPSLDILTTDTLRTLEEVHGSPLNLNAARVPQGDTVMNSFFSQFVPPFMELSRDLTSLWENELFETFKITPVVDHQGQRLFIKFSQDTISALLGPFTYLIAGLGQVELVSDLYTFISLSEIAEHLYRASRLSVYMLDIGSKYCPAAFWDENSLQRQWLYQQQQDRSYRAHGRTSRERPGYQSAF